MTVERKHQLTPLSEEAPAELGGVIYSLRIFNGFTQNDLSAEVSISQAYISSLEAGAYHSPSLENMIKLARAFGVGIDFLEKKESKRVFLRREARKAAELMLEPKASTALNFIQHQIPESPDQGLIYIEKSESDEQLRTKVKRYRLIKELTQKELAKKSHLSQGYVSQIETGYAKAIPSFSTVKKLIETLQINLEDFLDIKEIKPPSMVTAFDRYFRNEEISNEEKRRVRKAINILSELVNNTSHSN